MDGILIVDKPSGPTSAEIVRRGKRRTKGRVGHLGTLDPFASGLLPLCLGEGTKVAQFLNDADKEYEGTIRLGVASDTGDPTGTRIFVPEPIPDFDDATLRRVAQTLTGPQLQTPPMYSAIKRDGQPLYKLARAGITIDREARRIEIFKLELHRLDGHRLAFRVASSKGTYVRVLAEEIARGLGTVGHLEELRRTRFGQFDLSQAVASVSLDDTTATLPIIDVRRALANLAEQQVSPEVERQVRHGNPDGLRGLAATPDREPLKLIDHAGKLIAVVAYDADAGWHYARVF